MLQARAITAESQVDISLALRADLFRQMSQAEREAFVGGLEPDEAEALLFDWRFWRRDNQAPPQEFTDGLYLTWLVMAGRGYGKTRTGAEQIRDWVKAGFRYVNLIGPTADDIRDAMIEGESGILAICPNDERPQYVPSRRQLIWPSGAISLLFSAEEPDRLRNKQHEKLWMDELAAWKYRDTFDQAQFGLRLGKMPQSIITTTPRPTALVKEIIADKTTIVTRGTTYENRANLAPAFYAKVVTKYEGTRLGRQELNAEVLEDNPGALFHLSNIEKNRVTSLPMDIERVVVGVDPAASANENSDETGIVAVAVDKRIPPHYYVLEDASGIYTPDGWGKKVVEVARANDSDRVVAEVNNGGDMVEAVIRNVDQNIPYKAVRASRGKVVRAEPIAGLYEQNRVHHVGNLSKLEDQMTSFNPTTFQPGKDASPDRMDAAVWGLTELSGTYQGQGLVEYFASGMMQKDVDAMNKVKTATTLIKPTTGDQTEACPECASKILTRIGKEFRCQGCGKMLARQADGKMVDADIARRALLAKLQGAGRVQ